MTQSVEKSSQASSWVHSGQACSCQHHQERTQLITTLHMLIKKKIPVHTVERTVWGYHAGSMNSHSCWAATAQFWQSFRSGSTASFRRGAQIVQAMCSGITKALASIGTYRILWTMTDLAAGGGVSAGNPDTAHRGNPRRLSVSKNLTNWSTGSSAFKLMVPGTH